MAPNSPVITTYCVTLSIWIIPAADGLGDGGSQKKSRHEIEERSPRHRQLWG